MSPGTDGCYLSSTSIWKLQMPFLPAGPMETSRNQSNAVGTACISIMGDIANELTSASGPLQTNHERLPQHVLDSQQRGATINAFSGATVIVGDVYNLSSSANQLTSASGPLQTNHERLPQHVLDAVRRRYIKLCEVHEIHYVDQGVIKMRKFPINDFAVNLKLVSSSRMVGSSFRGEKDRYLNDLNKCTSEHVEIDNLINENTRVSFLRGIAGIGKSVLAKQIAFGWANGTIYKNYEVCLFFECRELNDFIHDEEESFNPKRIVHNFLKMKLRYLHVDDLKNMLIIIDGVDELFDIKKKNSLIFQFLDQSKLYGDLQIIMTGRPHVESVLDNLQINIGNYQIIEIMGLGDNDIQDYIVKFSECFGEERSVEYSNFISQTIDASVSIRPALYVPQFLNAVCCVSIVTGGKDISNESELYCWLLYLLLKQHVFEREEVTDDNIVFNVFTRYRQSILLLSKISYQLYLQNRIIFSRDEFKPLFDKLNEGASTIEKGFFEGLFVSIPDNFKKKLQFKHLSLMEFLSAIHVCTVENPADAIAELLESDSYEIVRYACGLCGGVFHDGIVNELHKYVIETEREEGMSINDESFRRECAESFLLLVLRALGNSNCLERVAFTRAIEFVEQFLSPQFDRIDFVKCILVQVGSFGNAFVYEPDVAEQIKFVRFCRTMETIGIEKSSIHSILNCTGLRLCDMHCIDMFSYATYFYHCTISLRNAIVNEHWMEVISNNLIYYDGVGFQDCVFENLYAIKQLSVHHSNLKYLSLDCCTFSQSHFEIFSQWAVLSSVLRLHGPMNIDKVFWDILGNRIDFPQHRASRLEKLEIFEPSFNNSSWESAVKVFIKLKMVFLEMNDICEDWWKILCYEIEERVREETLNLRSLSISSSSKMTKDILQRIQECDVMVIFTKQKTLASQSGSSITELVKNESQDHSEEVTSPIWLLIEENAQHHVVGPVKTLASELIFNFNEDRLEQVLRDFTIVVKDSHGCIPPASIQEKIIFATILKFINQRFAIGDSRMYLVFNKLVRHIRFTALMKFERESMLEDVNKLEDKALIVQCTKFLQNDGGNDSPINHSPRSLSRSKFAPIPFKSNELACDYETNILRNFDDESSAHLYIKGMKIWIRFWARFPVWGGFEVLYSNGRRILHGDRFDHEVYEFVLAPDEYIVKVIASSGYMVDSLEFITNTGNSHGPYGGNGGKKQIISHPRGFGYLSHVSGSETRSLGSIGIVNLAFHFMLFPEPGYDMI